MIFSVCVDAVRNSSGWGEMGGLRLQEGREGAYLAYFRSLFRLVHGAFSKRGQKKAEHLLLKVVQAGLTPHLHGVLTQKSTHQRGERL